MKDNKCEKLGIVHAWTSDDKLVGFSFSRAEKCANCDLERSFHSHTKEWYSYSDGRPDEPIINIRPV